MLEDAARSFWTATPRDVRVAKAPSRFPGTPSIQLVRSPGLRLKAGLCQPLVGSTA
jgi:hypothetical protein